LEKAPHTAHPFEETFGKATVAELKPVSARAESHLCKRLGARAKLWYSAATTARSCGARH